MQTMSNDYLTDDSKVIHMPRDSLDAIEEYYMKYRELPEIVDDYIQCNIY